MVPFLVAVHWHGFDTGHFGGYFRVATAVVTMGNAFGGLSAASSKTVRGYRMVRGRQSGSGMALGMAMCGLSLMFGIREATIPLCQGDAWKACLERRDEGCKVFST